MTNTILTFLSGVLVAYLTNIVIDKFEKERKYIFKSKALKNYSEYIWADQVYGIETMVTNCIVWKSLTKKKDKGFKVDSFKSETIDIKTYDAKLQTYIQNNWKEKLKKSPNLTVDVRCGLGQVCFEDGTLSMSFYKTNYMNFLGTNVSIDKSEFNEFISQNERRLLSKKDGYKELSKSILSNDLATATTVVTKDGKLLLSKRSNEVMVVKGKIHTSIAEGMQFGKDFDENGDISPYKTIVRGAKEELGITIVEDDIEVTSIGVYRPFAQPFITAYVKLDKTYDEIKNLVEIKELQFEGSVFTLDMNIRTLAPFLLNQEILDNRLEMAELARISIANALIRRQGMFRVRRGLKRSSLYDNG